ncbi:MAG: carboxypeptidase regulatory-like domain-containing protein [Sedimentisphaerales bacterium]|nr:carboxypeptidase regulatory-like domain-containing protein [Sedimentisphaerales bacterium]
MKPTVQMRSLTLAFSIVLVQSLVTSGQAHIITGRVVDYLGRPVQGAEVALHEKTGRHTAEMRDEIRITDQDGRFAFTTDVSLSVLRVYVIVARKDGLALGWDLLEHIDDNVIVLDRLCSVGGVVVDANDRPVAGAVVRAAPKNSQLRRLEQLPILAPPSWLTTQTDDDGRFLFGVFSAEVSTDFWVKAPDRQLVFEYSPHMMTLCGFEVGRTDIRLVLPRESPVQGQVVDVDSGAPVDGARVLLEPKDLNPDANPFIPLATTTGSDGRFSFQRVPPGQRYVAVSAPDETGLVDRRVTFDVGAGAPVTEVTAELRRGGTIEIVAREEQTGAPIAGLPVHFWQAVQTERSDFYRDAHTDANGVLRVPVPVGECAFSTRSDRYIPMFYEGAATVLQGRTVETTILLEGYTRVSGTVLDASGQSVPDAVVTGLAVASDYFAKGSARTDRAGRFEVSLPPGNLPGVWVARHSPLNLVGLRMAEQAAEPLCITMNPACLIAGRVVDPNGNGIPAARVGHDVVIQQLHVSMPYAPDVATDAEGRFELRSIATGQAGFSYRLSVSACGYGNSGQRVAVPREPGARIELEPIVLVPADRSVTGIVADANGARAGGALVSAYGRSQLSRTTVSDAAGRFTLHRLCQAPVSIQGSLSRQAGGTVEAEGGDRDVKIILGQRRVHQRYASLEDKPLPPGDALGLNFSHADIRDGAILLCFFDFQQRPSRNALLQLAGRAEALKQKGVIVVGVQASEVDADALSEWVTQSDVALPVGRMRGDIDATRLAWGVKSLPWLVLADRKHVVRAEGFALDELEAHVNRTTRD